MHDLTLQEMACNSYLGIHAPTSSYSPPERCPRAALQALPCHSFLLKPFFLTVCKVGGANTRHCWPQMVEYGTQPISVNLQHSKLRVHPRVLLLTRDLIVLGFGIGQPILKGTEQLGSCVATTSAQRGS
jgi:hypothetical protein